ncbi:hypothetical protein ACGFMM_34280 [Streptomyces sp. NPDC048604]|uniref:hypothetical protein n=1 Tax=Streptomyces sp. NPDC048604 TaxID=3365578 RepID=UPI00372203C6
MATIATSTTTASPERVRESATTESAVGYVSDPNAAYDPIDDTMAKLPEVDAKKEPLTSGPVPMRCDNPVRTWYEIASAPVHHIKWPGTSFKDGPGGTMVVKVETAGKPKIEGTAGFETEVSGVVAAAKAKVDVTLGVEVGITVGHEYRRNIGNAKYGHTAYGSWGRKVTWKKYWTSADRCGKTLARSGTFNIPDRDELGWRYWETSS